MLRTRITKDVLELLVESADPDVIAQAACVGCGDDPVLLPAKIVDAILAWEFDAVDGGEFWDTMGWLVTEQAIRSDPAAAALGGVYWLLAALDEQSSFRADMYWADSIAAVVNFALMAPPIARSLVTQWLVAFSAYSEESRHDACIALGKWTLVRSQSVSERGAPRVASHSVQWRLTVDQLVSICIEPYHSSAARGVFLYWLSKW